MLHRVYIVDHKASVFRLLKCLRSTLIATDTLRVKKIAKRDTKWDYATV